MSGENIEEIVEALLDQLVMRRPSRVAPASEKFLIDMAFKRAHLLLRFDEDIETKAIFEARLRLALHLSPRSAIRYDLGNPRPRWRLIDDYLVRSLGRHRNLSEPLARQVAAVLDNWQRGRQQVTRHRHYLVRRDGPTCSNCHVRFDDVQSPTVTGRDPYKPYHTSPDELLAAEVDHIEPISATGTNQTENLQLLCRLCNAGKGDGLGIELRHEALNSAIPLEDVPSFHLMRLVYHVVSRDQRLCTQCGSDSVELTIRPFISDGPLVRSNLHAVCVECAA